jgi:hypothetical protein
MALISLQSPSPVLTAGARRTSTGQRTTTKITIYGPVEPPTRLPALLAARDPCRSRKLTHTMEQPTRYVNSTALRISIKITLSASPKGQRSANLISKTLRFRNARSLTAKPGTMLTHRHLHANAQVALIALTCKTGRNGAEIPGTSR